MEQNLNPSYDPKEDRLGTESSQSTSREIPHKRDHDYGVGYKKPPKETRFKKGQSGNPQRRPSRLKTHAQSLSEALDQTVWVTQNGRRRKMPKREAMLKRVINAAAQGDEDSLDAVLKLIAYHHPRPRNSDKKAASLPINPGVSFTIPPGYEYPKDPELIRRLAIAAREWEIERQQNREKSG